MNAAAPNALKSLRDWLTLSDYEADVAVGTLHVAGRFGRRNIPVQNGDILDDEDMVKLREAGNKALARLNRRAGRQVSSSSR